MPGQPDDPDVVTEVLATELGPDAEVACHLKDEVLGLNVAEAMTRHVSGGGEAVEIPRACVLGHLERVLSARATDDHGKVIRGAGCGAEFTQFLVQEGEQRLLVQDRLGLLVEE